MEITDKINYMSIILDEIIPLEIKDNIFNKLLQIEGYITPPSSPRKKQKSPFKIITRKYLIEQKKLKAPEILKTLEI
jgi:hypothetical protein